MSRPRYIKAKNARIGDVHHDKQPIGRDGREFKVYQKRVTGVGDGFFPGQVMLEYAGGGCASLRADTLIKVSRGSTET